MAASPPEPTVPTLVPPTLPTWAERQVTVGGLRTRLFEMGEGPPLVLIPSAFLRAPSYRGTIAALARDFRVIAAEMPGTGRSQSLPRAWGFAEGADWAAGLLDALELETALVVGHSDAGGVAALMGARHADRLDGIVMADSVGAFPGATWWGLLGRRMRDGMTQEYRLNLPLMPHVILGLMGHPRNFAYHAFRLASSTEPLEIAPKIAAPTLLAWGRSDHTFPPECAERFRAAIPDSRIAWSDASHDWLITDPRAFASAVGDFARELRLLPDEAAEPSGALTGTRHD